MTVTVLSGPDRRRRWTFAEKLRMGEFLAPEAIIAEVARRHDIHPNHFMHGGAKHALRLLTSGPPVAAHDGCRFVLAVKTPTSDRIEPRLPYSALQPVSIPRRLKILLS